MNPTLFRLLSSLGPRAAGLLGLSGGIGAGLNSLSGATQGDIVTDPGFLSHLKSKFGTAYLDDTASPNARVANGFDAVSTPNMRVASDFGALGPMPSYGIPMPRPRPFGAAMAQAPASVGNGSVPMPQPRPQEAPQMGFFQRNALMQKDPITGEFLDPKGAASAQNSLAYSQGNGSDLIAKFLDYFHGKVPS